MRLFGLDIRWPATKAKSALSAVDTGNGGWFGLIREPFGGAWQRFMPAAAPKDVLAYSAVYSCVSIIAADIAKLRLTLQRRNDDGTATEVVSSPFLPVIQHPNHYQNRLKFIEQWIVSKLIYGNAYALKRRDARGIVTGLYLLPACRVTPLVAADGSVFYQLSRDDLSGVAEDVTAPASEIIHDTMISLWHPLVGVSPIYACGVAASMGNKIVANSTRFFDNMSRPSGALTAPGVISDETANRLKKAWEENFSGSNIGHLAVLGDGLKYEPMTIPASDAQLIEQLKWTIEDVARCFHVPLFKLGGPLPPNAGIEALNQMYYSECLQSLIEALELSLDEGLALPSGMHVEFELSGLLRMDTAARYDAKNKAVGGGWMSPNEARRGENLPPVQGGESPMIQQQNYSLAALARRDALDDPFNPRPPAPPALPAPEPSDDDEDDGDDDEEIEMMMAEMMAAWREQVTQIAELKAELRSLLEAPRPTMAEIQRAIAEQLAALPKPRDGANGANGLDGATGSPGEKGATGDKGDRGEPGKDADPAQVAALLLPQLQKAFEEKLAGLRAPTAEDFRHLFEAEQAKWALEFERYAHSLLRHTLDTIETHVPEDGKDGLGIEDLDVKHDGEGKIDIVFARGDVRRGFTIKFPCFKYRGIWRESNAYHEGNGVTYDGSLWLATKDAPEGKPGNGNGHWQLAVKRGQDGRDYSDAKPAPREPVRLK